MLPEFARLADLQRINGGRRPCVGISQQRAYHSVIVKPSRRLEHMITRTCAAGALLAALSMYGCATTNAPPQTAAARSSACLTSTGSRIPASPGTPCTAYGRTYSRTDIDQTGKTTVGGALGLLDPSLSVTR